MSLSPAQIQAIDITEKACSVFSVIGEAFVIVTFLFSSKFRKPINRLVFYATWGNIFANVATLIGRTGISSGLESPLCQFQSFLIQWFMPADALWTFAMACNVWLSFFHHYDAPKLRALEWKYLLLCYGLPLPPAFTFLFVATRSMGRVYGDAVLWCWFSLEWDFLRVAVFYAPVWVVILLTVAIYLRVGAVIWKWRRQLVSLGKYSEQDRQQRQANNTTPVVGIRRTDEVIITQEVALDIVSCPHFPGLPYNDATAGIFEKRLSTRLRDRALTLTRRSRSRGSKGTFREASSHANKAAIKYCKCAILFFIALLVTWVPSTINRIYTLVYPEREIFGLQFAAALVLPLQGLWNAVIYIATSAFACQCLWRDMLIACRIRKPVQEPTPLRREIRALSLDSRGDWRAESDTNSLKPVQTH